MADPDNARRVRMDLTVPSEAPHNEGTCAVGFVPMRDPFDVAPAPEALTAALEDCSHGVPGVALLAISMTGEVEGALWLAATDRLRGATVGHHDKADLTLPDRGGLSLRHFVVLVHAVEEGVRWRVIDLRTPMGLQTDDGQTLRSFHGDGAVRFAAGSWLFVLVPVGLAGQWTAGAPDAWRRFPKARYRDADGVLRSPARLQRAVVDGEEHTDVVVRRGVSEAVGQGLLGSGEVPVGVLEVMHGTSRASLAVGEAALDGGVLLGRYERCDVAELSTEDHVSRVHGLVFRDEGKLYVFDTGSTAGITCRGRAVKLEPVEPSARYQLARVAVCWQPVALPQVGEWTS